MIAYCHTLLIEAESLRAEGKGIAILDDEDTRQFSRDCGIKIIDFCECNGATKDQLGRFCTKGFNTLGLLREYYGLQIKLYLKYVSEVNGRHIPILYAGLLFQLLEKNGFISLGLDYERLISEIEKSSMLETNTRKSRFGDSEIVEKKEVNKYHNAVRLILEKTMIFKVVKPNKKKMSRGKR